MNPQIRLKVDVLPAGCSIEADVSVEPGRYRLRGVMADGTTGPWSALHSIDQGAAVAWADLFPGLTGPIAGPE